MLGYDKLMNFYKTNFSLIQHHKYSLYDIEHMIPWERLLYVNLLQGYLKEQSERMRDQAATNRAQNRRR